MFLSTAAKAIFAILLNPQFWSKLGFFISYLATCLIVLEVLRLVYSDASKRDVEKMLDNYTRSRLRSPSTELRRRERAESKGAEMKVSLQELEREIHVPSPPRRRSPAATRAVTPESERTLVDTTHRRRSSRTASTEKVKQKQQQQQQQQQQEHHQHAPPLPTQHLHADPTYTQLPPQYPYPYPYPYPYSYPSHSQPQPSSPPRRLRKRTDTLVSTTSGDSHSKPTTRRRRETSPASATGSAKTSSSRSSPRRTREEREKRVSAGLGRILRVRG